MSATVKMSESIGIIFRTAGQVFIIRRGTPAREYNRLYRLGKAMTDIVDVESTVRALSLEGSSPKLKEQRRKLKRLTEKRDSERAALKNEGWLL